MDSQTEWVGLLAAGVLLWQHVSEWRRERRGRREVTDLSSSTSSDEKLISDDDELMSAATVPCWMATARPTAMPQNSIGPKAAMLPRLGTPAATGGRAFACLGESGRQANFKRGRTEEGIGAKAVEEGLGSRRER